LVNGQILTVARVRESGEIATREGPIVPALFGQLAHGYAVTSHASQGRTVDHVVIAGDQLSARSLYVASSRGRKSATLFVPDKDRLKESLKDSETRPVALDLRRLPSTVKKNLLETAGRPADESKGTRTSRQLPQLEA
jgi:ATP-dependent exoDNAse (exonuclease V) alpha subunit